VVVVVSAGNAGDRGAGTVAVPGNDPYVITVGANDDARSPSLGDDSIPSWSSKGPTAYDGLQKPDVVAGGRQVVSIRVPGSYLDRTINGRVVQTNYFRLTGTSMAAPVVSGAAALILSANPSLTPNQVKHILKSTARPLSGPSANAQGSGQIDALAAVQMATSGQAIPKANLGAVPNSIFARSIYTLAQGMNVKWRSPTYRGYTWTDGGWDTVGSYNGTAWTDGGWDTLAWENLAWENIPWENPQLWTGVTWESLTGWTDGGWDTTSWTDGGWDNGGWDNGGWDNGGWDNGGWDATNWDTVLTVD
jgi:serine protease AprX